MYSYLEHNRNELLSAEGSNKKTEIYQREIVAAQERYFPLITVRRRSTDPPWYNWKIRKRIAQKKGVYRREGKSAKWRRLRKVIEDLIEKRRTKYAGARKTSSLPRTATGTFSKM